jgi:hypothetical protein
LVMCPAITTNRTGIHHFDASAPNSSMFQSLASVLNLGM